jgi:predicted transcriptional regulator
MDIQQTKHIALISIHPKYAQAIIHGHKRVEFRKGRFARAVSHVVIYATAPVSKVVGLFVVRGIHQSSVGQLWRSYRTCGGILRRAFFSYYYEKTTGVAIEIGNVHKFSRPLPLSRFSDVLSPPQNYIYIERDRLRRALWRVDSSNMILNL